MSDLPATSSQQIPRGLTLAEYVTIYSEAIGATANRLARSFLLPDALRILHDDTPDRASAKVRDVGILLARCLSTGEDIMALAQSIYLVGGKPALAAAYLVARAQQTGAILGAPRYVTDGAWPDISVTATARTADGETHSVTVSMQEAREDGWAGKNPKYRSHRPAENMLCNRAAARLIRRVAPGVVLGMAVAEEAQDYDERRERVTVETVVSAERPTGRAALGLPAPGPEPVDYRAEADHLSQRETVEAHAEPVQTEPVAEAPTAAQEPAAAAATPESAPTADIVERGPRRPRNAAPRLAALGYVEADIARMPYGEMHRILDGQIRKAPATEGVPADETDDEIEQPSDEPERTGPVTEADLGWTRDELDWMRPEERARIVPELLHRDEWRVTPHHMLERREGAATKTATPAPVRSIL
jgi:hypothetical protein